jgi:hypothetical protein
MQFDFASPYNEANLPSVRVKRSVNVNPESDFDNFYMVFRMVTGDVDNMYVKGADGSVTEKLEKTLTVEFDDKSKITDDTIKVTHDVTEDRTEGIRTLFYPVNEANLSYFSEKKITKFSLGGYEKKFSADSANAVMQYVKCIKNAPTK